MDVFWQELTFGLPETKDLIRVIIRLVIAALLGAVIGFQRESAGKPAGLRTHILVTVGTSVFVLAGVGYGMNSDGLSRIIQGIVTGIGFVGAGSILKISEERDVKGLTTSAGIWLASAVGVAVGLGELGLALLATVLALITLTLIRSIETGFTRRREAKDKNDEAQ